MAAAGRRYDIDWLRVLAMSTIFFFHCARFFDEGDWHVKNNQLNFRMSVFVGVVSQWVMPLFFVLSATGAYYALSHRDNGRYIGERVKRLVIPLLFGILVLIPPQVYIERVSHSQFSGSLIEFFPHYFKGFYGLGGNFAWMGLHLWYLEALFLFSLLTLPLFRYLRNEKGQGFVSWTTGSLKAPGAIFLLAVPVVVMEIFVNLDSEVIGRRDFGGWSLLTYMVFFILGYLIACDVRFQVSIERQRVISLVMGVISTTVGFFLLESGYSSRTSFFALLRGFNSWFWLMAILGFGGRYLGFTNRMLKYSNEAVLPFYILHQTIIVIIGYTIADWNTGLIVKYAVLSITSFVVIVTLYDMLVRRVHILRFLFGMKY